MRLIIPSKPKEVKSLSLYSHPFYTMKQLVTSHNLTGKSVILRLDLDVPVRDGKVADDTRLQDSLLTIEYCLEHASKTLIIGHLGRPKYEDLSLSLMPIKIRLEEILKQTISFFPPPASSHVPNLARAGEWRSNSSPLGLLENLRFFPGEENNDPAFAKTIADFGDIFVNDAFAVSHRPSASGIGVPRILPSLLGLHFEAELKALHPIIDNPKSPIIAVIGGAKTDKIEIVDNLLTHVDKVLVGGSIAASTKPSTKTIPATLTEDGLDINSASIDIFSKYISTASTLIWNGPMGKYEDNLHGFHGTYQIAQAIANSGAYKVAGGGDTLAVINKLNLNNKFNHLSTGGGAMIYYITKHTLPALDAILNSPKIT